MVNLKQAARLSKRQPARPREKRQARIDKDGPSVETTYHGQYVKEFTHHDESGTKTETFKNRRSHIVDKWIEEGGLGFEGGAVTAIKACEFLWERMKSNKLTANYGESIAGAQSGMDRYDAIDRMAKIKKGFPSSYWGIFENVVRNRMPAGVAGSDLANNSSQSIASARAIVGFIACKIAEDNSY